MSYVVCRMSYVLGQRQGSTSKEKSLDTCLRRYDGVGEAFGVWVLANTNLRRMLIFNYSFNQSQHGDVEMSKNEQKLYGQIEGQIEGQIDSHNSNKLNTQKQNHEIAQETRQLKDRFLEAVAKGELGTVENSSTVVTLKEFKAYFSDIKTDYINSFLPAATLEHALSSASHTKYLFRVRKGAYLVHPETLEAYVQQKGNLSSSSEGKGEGEEEGEDME